MNRPKPETPPDGPLRLPRALQAYRTVGLLGLLSVVALLVGLFLQHTTSLPSAYTWFEPLRTVRLVFEARGFPTAMLLVYWLALVTRNGVSAAMRDVRGFRGLALPEERKKALRRLALALLLPSVDFVVLRTHGALDLAAVACIGWHAGAYDLSRRHVLGALGYVLFSVVVFLTVCFAYTVVKALLFVGRPNLDQLLMDVEHAVFGFYPHRVLAAFASTRPLFVKFCDWVYFRFFDHMILTSVLLTGLRLHRERNEFLGAVVLCYLIGAPLYYLLPGLGPGFYEAQYFGHLATQPLTFGSVRRWLFINTISAVQHRENLIETWGYIACMPSLHMAHELVMLYYVRHSRIALFFAAPFTTATFVATIVLGFHYPIDALGGLMVAVVAIYVTRRSRASLLPSLLTPPEDEPLASQSGRQRRSKPAGAEQ